MGRLDAESGLYESYPDAEADELHSSSDGFGLDTIERGNCAAYRVESRQAIALACV